MNTPVPYGRARGPRGWLGIATAALLLSCGRAEAFVYKVLHNFSGRNGAYPSGGLIADSDGNLYGVTSSGGGRGCACGAVFEVTPKGKENVLYRFKGGPNGSGPEGALVRDQVGNLYGVAGGGPATNACGIVFRLTPDGRYTVLHTFAGGYAEGCGPNDNLVLDEAGNLYGTTGFGGGYGCGNEWGCGTIYKLAPNRTMTLLYAFQGGSDGDTPYAGLLRDNAGNLYGVTMYGGNSGCTSKGCGVVFELPVGGSEKILHAFDLTDGYLPETGLTADSQGNLYGATSTVGSTLYQLSPGGVLHTLFQFHSGDANGTWPTGNIVLRDEQGDLFVNNNLGGVRDKGTIFELAADGTASALHEFDSWPQDGSQPEGNLLLQKNRLYGVTRFGGVYNEGTIWVLAK